MLGRGGGTAGTPCPSVTIPPRPTPSQPPPTPSLPLLIPSLPPSPLHSPPSLTPPARPLPTPSLPLPTPSPPRGPQPAPRNPSPPPRCPRRPSRRRWRPTAGAELALGGSGQAAVRARALSQEGEQLIERRHYAVDSIRPQCHEPATCATSSRPMWSGGGAAGQVVAGAARPPGGYV